MPGIRRIHSPWAVSDGVAARYACVSLVNDHPHLWPLLNRLTVSRPVDWNAALLRLDLELTESTP